MPEQVLRDEPEAPCQQHLKHAALNIEIRPWKVSAVKINTTTPPAEQEAADVQLDDIPHPDAHSHQDSTPHPEAMLSPEGATDSGVSLDMEDIHPPGDIHPVQPDAAVRKRDDEVSEPLEEADQESDKDEDSKSSILREKTEVDDDNDNKIENNGGDGLRQCETVLIIEGNKSTGDLSLSNSPNTSMDAEALQQSALDGNVMKPQSSTTADNDSTRLDSTQDYPEMTGHDQDEGTRVDPNSTVKTDLTDWIPVDSDGLERPTSVKCGQGGVKHSDGKTVNFDGTSVDPGVIKRTDQTDASPMEGVLKATPDDTYPNDIMSSNNTTLDEVDTANVSPNGRDVGKPEHITNNDQNIPSVFGTDKVIGTKEIPLSIEPVIMNEQEEKSYRPVAAVSPHITDTPSHSENSVNLQGQPPVAPSLLSDSEFTQIDVAGSPAIQQGLEGQADSNEDLQMTDSNDINVTSPETLTQTDTLFVAVREEGTNLEAAADSYAKPQEAQDSLKEMSSEGPVHPTEAVMIQLTSGEVILLKEPNSPLKKMSAQDREMIVDQAVVLRSVRGRSMTPLRPARQSLKRRSRSLSPNSLEDAFFKMAEADSKQFIESAIQTESLSSGSSSPHSKASHKLSHKGKHKSKKRPSSMIESGDDTSRSVSPIESSSESSALVQQALNTIRGAGTYGNAQARSDVSDPQSSTYGHNERVEVIHQESIASEEATRKTSSACIQTGDSLTNIAGAITAIQDPGVESELEHSTMLMPDFNTSLGSTTGGPHLREHLDQVGAVIDRGSYSSQSSPRGVSTSTPLTGAQSLESIPAYTSRRESPYPPHKVGSDISQRNEGQLDLQRGTTPDSNQGSHGSADSAVTVLQATYGSHPSSAAHTSKDDGFHKGRSQFEEIQASDVRTIETQTYPNMRVIETQTSTDLRVMETQTSPRQWAEAEATQTEISLDSSVQSLGTGPHGSSTLEVMVGPSSLSTAQQQETLSHAPTTITSQTEVAMEKYIIPDLAEHVSRYGRKTKAGRRQSDDVMFGEQDGLNALPLVDDSFTVKQETSDDDQIDVKDETVSRQSATAANASAPGSTSSSDDSPIGITATSHDQDQPSERAKSATHDRSDGHDLSFPTIDLNTVDLETLKIEHQRLLDLMRKSKEEKDRRISQRKLMLEERAAKVEGWMKQFDDMDNEEPQDSKESSDLIADAVENATALPEKDQPENGAPSDQTGNSVRHVSRQQEENDPEADCQASRQSNLSDDTFNTGGYPDDVEMEVSSQIAKDSVLSELANVPPLSEVVNAPALSDAANAPAIVEVAKVSQLSVSQSQSSSSSSESLATVKSVPPRSGLPTTSPLSVTSSIEDSVHTPPPSDKPSASQNLKDLSDKTQSLAQTTSADLVADGDDDVDESLPEVIIDEAALETTNIDKLDSSNANLPAQTDVLVSQNISLLDTSDFDNQSSNSSRLSAYGVKLDTSIESNQEISQGVSESIDVIPASIEGSIGFYGNSDGNELDREPGETPTADQQNTAALDRDSSSDKRKQIEDMIDPSSVVPTCQVKQPDSLMDPSLPIDSGNFEDVENLEEPGVVPEGNNLHLIESLIEPSTEAGISQSADVPIPVATSSPSRKQKSRSQQAAGSGTFEDEGFSSLQSHLESEGKPEGESTEKEVVISAGKEGSLGSVPHLMLEDDKISLDGQQDPAKADDYKLSPRSHKKSSSDGHKGIELEVPSADLNLSASSSIEDWTQTDDLGEWSPRRGYADTGTDTETNDLLDELERLRRERQRILDMLAKDVMPSKLQVCTVLSRACYIITYMYLGLQLHL